MLLDVKIRRSIIFLVLLTALILALIVFAQREAKLCLGVPLISTDELSKYSAVNYLDAAGITFDGEPVPFDWESNTIYLSQSASSLSDFCDLKGCLASENPAQQK